MRSSSGAFLALLIALAVAAPLSCRQGGEQVAGPYSNSQFAGRWSLEEAIDVGKVIPVTGYAFSPSPPASFELEFRVPPYFTIEGLEWFGSLRLHEDPEHLGEFFGNSPPYYCTVNMDEEPPSMRLKVLLECGSQDELVYLATYRKVD